MNYDRPIKTLFIIIAFCYIRFRFIGVCTRHIPDLRHRNYLYFFFFGTFIDKYIQWISRRIHVAFHRSPPLRAFAMRRGFIRRLPIVRNMFWRQSNALHGMGESHSDSPTTKSRRYKKNIVLPKYITSLWTR